MVTYATNTDLSTQYFTRTRIWAGTQTNSFFVNDPIMINSGVTVRSNDSTVVTNRLGQHSGAASDEHGTLVLTNSTIDLNSTAAPECCPNLFVTTVLSLDRTVTPLLIMIGSLTKNELVAVPAHILVRLKLSLIHI